MLTLQQIFDKAVEQATKGIVCRLYGHTGICAYRNLAGERCFIGACIPDEVYKTTETIGGIEGMNGYEALQKLKLIGGDTDTELRRTINNLQSIHDMYHRSGWLVNLTEFAKTHNLTMNEEHAAMLAQFADDDVDKPTPSDGD